MEFKHIEYFIEAANHKSISKAAEALFISQQALSRFVGPTEIFVKLPKPCLSLSKRSAAVFKI